MQCGLVITPLLVGNVLSSGAAVQILSSHGLRVVEAFYYFCLSFFLGGGGSRKGVGVEVCPSSFHIAMHVCNLNDTGCDRCDE